MHPNIACVNRGMKMAVINCSNGDNLGEYFWLPFIETAKYLRMKYIGHVHTITGKDNDLKISEFIKWIERENKYDTGLNSLNL